MKLIKSKLSRRFDYAVSGCIFGYMAYSATDGLYTYLFLVATAWVIRAAGVEEHFADTDKRGTNAR